MVLTREETIVGGTVRLFDELFLAADVKKHYVAFAGAIAKTWHIDDELDDKDRRELIVQNSYAFLQADFDPSDFRQCELGQKLHTIASSYYRIEDRPERVFTMCFRYGDIDYTHKDHFSSGSGISLVYYPNPEWDPNWGGETVFFDEDNDASVCVGVKPGRLALFPGDIPHRAGVPLRLCPKIRVSLNLRYNLVR